MLRPTARRTSWLASRAIASCLCLILVSRSYAELSSRFISHAGECCHASGGPAAPAHERIKNIAFVVGAQKSGTNWVWEELRNRHPNMRSWNKVVHKKGLVPWKEPHYFDRVPLPNLNEYIKGFTGEQSNQSITYVDATPDYMHMPVAACRIAAAFPNAKIIVLLKDPVARALSQWNMINYKQKHTIKSFQHEVKWELKQLRARNCSFEVNSTSSGGSSAAVGSTGSWTRSPGLPSWNDCYRCLFLSCGTYSGPAKSIGKWHVENKCHHDFARAGIVRRGLYVYQLEWWLQLFPAEQLLVLNYDQVLEEPETVLDTIITFLGHDPKLKLPAKKASGYHFPHASNESVVYAEALEQLYSYYAHANSELYSLMDSLGPASGWRGTFPTSYQEYQDRAARLETGIDWGGSLKPG